MQPKVSIVIPVYNGANYMREAIDSALNQTYENCEVIVVNDGSTDETEQIALSYGDRIRYFAKENGGVSSALNIGIENMEGEYFQYLPHDDILHSRKIEKNIKAILESGDEMSIVWSGWNYNYTDGRGLKKFYMPYEYADKVTYSVFPLLFSVLNTVTVLLNKRYFDKVGRFKEELYTSQDYDMWFRTFIDQKTIYLDEELVNYRSHEKQGTKADPEFIQNCIALSEHMVSNLSPRQIADMFGNNYRYFCYLLDYYKRFGWEDCYYKVLSKFNECDEPLDGKNERYQLMQYLKSIADEKTEEIILYCAGNNARNLLRQLWLRDVPVKAFCDQDRSKVGTTIDGVDCIAINEINKEKNLVIVTKDDPEEVMSELKEKGIAYVTSFKEIGAVVYSTLPVKQKIVSVFK